MPLGKSENRTYLQISYGKLRQKSTSDNPEAVERENRQGDKVWELVFNFIEGQITGIYYKESDEYGNSFDVTIDDGEEKYGVSFKENSRYCQDFLSRLPNVDLSKWVKIAPYDFIPKDSEKNKQGITLWQNDEKLQNYFVAKEDDKFIYSHDFPESDGTLSKDDFMIYLIKVKGFLREYTKDNIILKLQKNYTEPVDEKTETEPIGNAKLGKWIDEANDDLPF